MAADEWFQEGRYDFWPEALADRFNGILEEKCNQYQAVFDSRIAERASAAESAAIREDTVRMNRWSTGADVANQLTGELSYLTVRTLGPLLAVIGSVLAFSQGPGWLEGVLVGVAILFWLLVLIVLIFDSDRIDDLLAVPAGLLGIGGVVIGGVLLVVWPSEDFGTLRSIGALAVAVVLALIVARFWDWAVRHLWTTSRSFLVMSAAIGLLVAVVRFSLLDFESGWLLAGASVGVGAGLVAGVVLGAVQFVLNLFYVIQERLKFRRASEAEFVQSTLWVMNETEIDLESDDFVDRSKALDMLEYLAMLLERPITQALSREDPSSRAIVGSELRSRAEALRALKRGWLFSEQGATDEVLDVLDSLVVSAANRRWLELPTLPDGDAAPERRSRLPWARVAVVLVVFAGVATFAWVQNQPGLISVVAVWAGAGLLELVTPGATGRLAQSGDGGSVFAGLLQRRQG